MAGKQAKTITRPQERAILAHLSTTQNPERDQAMFLLSIKVGLRSKEIASLTWSMVTDSEGQIADCIPCPTTPPKGSPVAPFTSTQS
ncbi:tyrosine-type recombinase/integrase [Candidatus Entotheonella palauensis]|uniref:tyrosine-type recombinase/integrase n=1 Tax=Candidatus Entotheonella palauensis TaxID=93172 RepID=UPI000B7D66F6|nr:tyrosine-type recombinase/integrase [Candidatus Entotheonella palauensis]